MNKIKSQPTLFLVREALSLGYIRHNKEEKIITVSWRLEVWLNPEQSFVKVCRRAWWEHQHTSLQHNICWCFHQVYENKLLCGTVSEIEIIMLGRLCLRLTKGTSGIQVEWLVPLRSFIVNVLDDVAAGRTGEKFAPRVYSSLKIYEDFGRIKEPPKSNFSSIKAHSSQADCKVCFISVNAAQLKTCCRTQHLWTTPPAFSLLLWAFVIAGVTAHTQTHRLNFTLVIWAGSNIFVRIDSMLELVWLVVAKLSKLYKLFCRVLLLLLMPLALYHVQKEPELQCFDREHK